LAAPGPRAPLPVVAIGQIDEGLFVIAKEGQEAVIVSLGVKNTGKEVKSASD